MRKLLVFLILLIVLLAVLDRVAVAGVQRDLANRIAAPEATNRSPLPLTFTPCGANLSMVASVSVPVTATRPARMSARFWRRSASGAVTSYAAPLRPSIGTPP